MFYVCLDRASVVCQCSNLSCTSISYTQTFPQKTTEVRLCMYGAYKLQFSTASIFFVNHLTMVCFTDQEGRQRRHCSYSMFTPGLAPLRTGASLGVAPSWPQKRRGSSAPVKYM